MSANTLAIDKPLHILQRPVNQVLQQLAETCQAYLADPSSPSLLTPLREQLHQLRGVFVILDEPQATVLMGEINALVQSLHPDLVSAEQVETLDLHRELLSEAVLEAQRYFDWLVQAGDKPFFDLNPLLQRLRKARTGSDDIVAAVPQRINIPQTALALRPQLQRVLLNLLQGDQSAVSQVVPVFAQLRQTADDLALHRLWWLAESLFQQAAESKDIPSRPLKQLLRDLDQCLRRLAGGVHELNQDLRVPQLSMRLEQVLAGTPQGAARLRNYVVYQAGGSRTDNAAARQHWLDRQALLATLNAVSEDLSHCQYRIDQFLRAPDHQAILRTEPWRLHNCSNVLYLLGLQALADMLRRQIPVLVRWQNPEHELTDDAVDLLARVFILVQSCLEALSEQARRHGQVVITAEVSEADSIWVPQRLELYRARQAIIRETADLIERAWILATDYIDYGGSPVWEGMQGILQHVTSGFTMLDDNRSVNLIQRLQPHLLRLIEQPKAVAEPQRCIALFADIIVSLSQLLSWSDDAADPHGQPLQRAQNLLQQLEELLNREPADEAEPSLTLADEIESFDELTEPLEPDSDSAAEGVVTPTALPSETQAIEDDIDQEIFEIFFEEAQGEAAKIAHLAPQWRDDPSHRDTLSTIRRAFHTLKGSGRMVGEQAFGEFAQAYEQLLNQILEGRLSPNEAITDSVMQVAALLPGMLRQPHTGLGDAPELQALMAQAQALAAAEPLPAAPTPAPADIPAPQRVSEQVTEAPQAQPPAVPQAAPTPLMDLDPELLEAFLEEAGEILDAADTTLQQWRDDEQDPKLLNNLRRGMHTLKGGARLTGLPGVGDLAHAAENVLEALAKQTSKTGDTRDQDLLQQALDRLNLMLEQVRQGQNPVAATALMTELQRQIGAAPAVPTEQQQAEEQTKAAALRDAFILESADILQASDLTLRRWQQDTANRELLNDLDRDLQALRDNARLAGVGVMGELVADVSTLLASITSQRLNPNTEIIAVIEQGLDAMGRMLDQLRHNVTLTPAEDVRHAIQELLQGKIATATAPTARGKPTAASASSDSIRVDAWLLSRLSNQVGESGIFRARIEQGVNTFQTGLVDLEQTVSRLRQQMRRLEINAEAQIVSRHQEDKHGREFDPLELDRFSELQQLSRALVEVVDDLANVQQSLDTQVQSLNQLLYEQNKINRTVQESLTQTRMVRFASVVPRLRRLIRQVADELGKRVELTVNARDDKIDRTVLENMIAALEHLLRNAVDHGIETPAVRQAAGKPETGSIVLELTHEGTEVLFTLQDDGAGLNFEAIRRKAESKGLLQPQQEIDQHTLINLLLQPGFSTATKVTQVSGRGVGMDVVNESIRSLRGSLRITSNTGKGTHVSVRLPTSLELTQALLVKANEAVYAIPLLSIEAVSRLAPDDLRNYLAGDLAWHDHAQHHYPLHSLSLLFSHDLRAYDAYGDTQLPILLFRSGEASMALLVDAILGRTEIVIKSVAPQISRLPGIAGATVLADGTVAVVLDLASLVRNVGLIESISINTLEPDVSVPDKPLVLVVDDSITMRKITTRLLERNHYQVRTAKDGVDAVALLDQQNPDVVILDIEMPRMDGFEVLTHIRNQPHYAHLPVIMVTSRSGSKHRQRADRLGISDYLVKPYHNETMLLAVQQVLRKVAA
jgi:chemosensory pili system protein ChpA (sensor histidine kinase/response regulator)